MLAGGIFAAILTAFALFAVTNADDIVVLTMLNISARTGGRPREWQIWTGQYAGFAVLVAVSLAAAIGLSQLPAGWLWLLGLVPMGLGLFKLAAVIRARKAGESVPPATVSGLTGVIALTIVTGADNISVYTPVFRTRSLVGVVVTVAVFMAAIALYCLAGSRFAARRAGRPGHRALGPVDRPCRVHPHRLLRLLPDRRLRVGRRDPRRGWPRGWLARRAPQMGMAGATCPLIPLDTP